MKIDVILICYNQELFIAQAVESILMQSISSENELRIVVADDSSTDNTLNIIRRTYNHYVKSYNTNHCFNQKLISITYLESITNLGISKNYQRAFSACNEADYIAVLEGDDYWSSPSHINQHVNFLSHNLEYSMSMNLFTIFKYENGEYITYPWNHSGDVHSVDTKTQISNGNQLGNLSACMFRNSCIQNLPTSMFDIPIADWMLGVMLSQQGPIAILRESTSVYRTNEHSQWASLKPYEQIKSLLTLSSTYDNFQNGLYHKYWKIYIRKIKSTLFKIRIKQICPNFIVSLIRKLKNTLKR